MCWRGCVLVQVLMHQATSGNKEQSALIGKQAVTHDDNDSDVLVVLMITMTVMMIVVI